MQILSRKDAQAAQVGQYFTGKECKYGHVANRYTQSGACVACVAIAAAAKRGELHPGVVVTREAREAERERMIADTVAKRDAKNEVLNKLVKIKLTIMPQDIHDIFEMTTALCLGESDLLLRADVLPTNKPVKSGSPIYEVLVPLEHVETVRQISNELYKKHCGFDADAVRAQILRNVEKIATDEASEPGTGRM